MVGQKYIFNGKLLRVDESYHGKSNTENSIVVYEVFTWLNGNAIFFDEHFQRMLDSIKLKNLSLDNVPSKEELETDVDRLADANNFSKMNIRLDLEFVNGKLKNYLLYFVKSIYPSYHQQKQGVKVGLYFGEREDPNAKIANTSLREKANKKIEKENLFEVLLVDAKGRITEGSRSNVFFVKNNVVYTPKTEKVLNGITRQKVFQLAKENNIRIEEVDIASEELSNFDSAFLTSTSMKVLPISQVEDVKFDVGNEVVNILFSGFK